jgi:hypothetical protein
MEYVNRTRMGGGDPWEEHGRRFWAPEVLADQAFSFKSDVYAFGMCVKPVPTRCESLLSIALPWGLWVQAVLADLFQRPHAQGRLDRAAPERGHCCQPNAARADDDGLVPRQPHAKVLGSVAEFTPHVLVRYALPSFGLCPEAARR